MNCKEFSKTRPCTLCWMDKKDSVKEHGNCDGVIAYDEALEGHYCSKCHFYDGVK